MTDEIRLVIPAEEEFRPVAHLVTGGLALRLDMTYDALDDLQTGIDALLALRDDPGDVVVSLDVGEGALHATVGPFQGDALRGLERDEGELGLRRVLETVVDTFEVEERDGGAYVELIKKAAS
ncbi:MAG: hypothetical protein JOZ56_05255 [Actinobacteria bacterium]|nr:hypothetical protein [Actinomycetota bacterium]